MLKQSKLQHLIPPQPTPRVPNKPLLCEPAPKLKIQHNAPVLPHPRVHPKDTSPDQTIAHHTRSHMLNSQPPVNLEIQLQQALVVTSSQYSHHYLPKDLLSFWCTPVTALTMPVFNTETGESLEYCKLRQHTKYKKGLGRILLQWTRTDMPMHWGKQQMHQQTMGRKNWNVLGHPIWICTCIQKKGGELYKSSVQGMPLERRPQ